MLKGVFVSLQSVDYIERVIQKHKGDVFIVRQCV